MVVLFLGWGEAPLGTTVQSASWPVASQGPSQLVAQRPVEQDQDRILEEELPLFQGHVQCDKFAPLCQELPGRAGITVMDPDWQLAS